MYSVVMAVFALTVNTNFNKQRNDDTKKNKQFCYYRNKMKLLRHL